MNAVVGLSSPAIRSSKSGSDSFITQSAGPSLVEIVLPLMSSTPSAPVSNFTEPSKLPLSTRGLSLAAMLLYRRRGQDKGAFLSSCAYLVFMLVGAAAAVYPNLLVSTTDPALNITIHNAAAGSYLLSIGLISWSFGMALAVGYFVFVYRMFRGKVAA